MSAHPPVAATPSSPAVPQRTQSPDYGIDAPGIRRGMFAIAAAGIALLAGAAWRTRPGIVGSTLTGAGALLTAYGLFMGTAMTWSSRVGKRRTRERLLDRVGALLPDGRWRGDETVLDVGCGRGLMLVGAARRLTIGVAIGVDVWRAEDQSDNTPEAALENARREGVVEHVDVETADARALPFEDASMDAVVSHWVVHNIEPAADRERALAEMWRVLRPGGVVALADIAHVPGYARTFASFGARDVTVDDGGWEARIMGALSGGSYRPQSLVARKSP